MSPTAAETIFDNSLCEAAATTTIITENNTVNV